MKILLASSSSGSRGGGEIFLKYLGQGLADRQHHVIFWCADHPRMDELAASLAPIGRVVRSPYRNFYDYKTRIIATCLNHGTSRRLSAEWHDFRPDVVHINKQNLEDGLDLLRAASLLGIPSLSTIHITQTAQFLGARFARLRDVLARRSLLAFLGPYVAVQEMRRKELDTFLRNGHETQTIFNGVPPLACDADHSLRQAKRRELGLGETEILVLAVGRMEAQKRPLLFLELAERLQARVPAARFLWVGNGSLSPQWDEWVSKRNLAGIIRRVDWHNDVKPFLFAADLFLHTAAYEGLPIALTEAMSAGLPCAVPGYLVEEVSFFSKETFLVIEEEGTVARALTNVSERQARAASARRLAATYFAIEKMAEEYEKLYTGLRSADL